MTSHFLHANSDHLLREQRPAAKSRGERPHVDLALPLETLAPHSSTPSTGPVARNSRSADRSAEARLQAQLQASSYAAVRRVRCHYDDGVLTLFGQMPSYYCVQVAISLARATLGNGVRIRNRLEVVPAAHTEHA